MRRRFRPGFGRAGCGLERSLDIVVLGIAYVPHDPFAVRRRNDDAYAATHLLAVDDGAAPPGFRFRFDHGQAQFLELRAIGEIKAGEVSTLGTV